MWENIEGTEQAKVRSDRLKVSGGWIVRTLYTESTYNCGVAVAQTFVPDPEHKWVLEKA